MLNFQRNWSPTNFFAVGNKRRAVTVLYPNNSEPVEVPERDRPPSPVWMQLPGRKKWDPIKLHKFTAQALTPASLLYSGVISPLKYTPSPYTGWGGITATPVDEPALMPESVANQLVSSTDPTIPPPVDDEFKSIDLGVIKDGLLIGPEEYDEEPVTGNPAEIFTDYNSVLMQMKASPLHYATDSPILRNVPHVTISLDSETDDDMRMNTDDPRSAAPSPEPAAQELPSPGLPPLFGDGFNPQLKRKLDDTEAQTQPQSKKRVFQTSSMRPAVPRRQIPLPRRSITPPPSSILPPPKEDPVQQEPLVAPSPATEATPSSMSSPPENDQDSDYRRKRRRRNYFNPDKAGTIKRRRGGRTIITMRCGYIHPLNKGAPCKLSFERPYDYERHRVRVHAKLEYKLIRSGALASAQATMLNSLAEAASAARGKPVTLAQITRQFEKTKCHTCAKEFARRDSLIRHLESKHGLKIDQNISKSDEEEAAQDQGGEEDEEDGEEEGEEVRRAEEKRDKKDHLLKDMAVDTSVPMEDTESQYADAEGSPDE